MNTSSQPGWNTSANVSLYSITFTNPIVMADFLDNNQFSRCVGQSDCTETSFAGQIFSFNVSRFTAYVANENIAPTIFNLTVFEAQTPIEKSNFTLRLNFSVSDANGFSDINDSSILVNITNSTFRKQEFCSSTNVNASTNNYNCSIIIRHYDPSGIWRVNISVQDFDATIARNDTTNFTLNTLSAIQFDKAIISFGNVNQNQENQLAANNPLVVDNTGNVNYINLTVRAIDVVNLSISGAIINATNFSVNVSTNPQIQLTNNTFISVNNSALNRDTDTSETNVSLFFLVDIGIVPSAEYKSLTDWGVGVQ